MYKLKCVNKCFKGGLLRRVGDTMSAPDKKTAEDMEQSGHWELLEAPVKTTVAKEPSTKAASKEPAKDPLA